MRKYCLPVILCLVLSPILLAQKIPKNLNQTDDQNQRQGQWTILYDQDWNIIQEKNKAQYYRVINYQDDKPTGKVYDYYLNGQVQMETILLADRPEEVMDGEAIWYHEDGRKESKKNFEAGKLLSEIYYDDKGNEENPSEAYAQAIIDYQNGRFENTLPVLERYFSVIIGSFDNDLKKQILFMEILQDCYFKTGHSEDGQKMQDIIDDLHRLSADSWKEHKTFGMKMSQGRDYKNAAISLEKAKRDYLQFIQKKDLEYAHILNELAICYYELRNLELAEPLNIEALQLFKELLGEKNKSYPTAVANLALLYERWVLYEKAEPLRLEVVRLQKEISGEADPEYATALNNLALLYRTMGKYPQALPLYIEALKIRKESLGEQNALYGQSLNNLAGLYAYMGEYTKAEPLQIEALQVRKLALGENHPDYAQTLNNVGFLYKNMGIYKKSEEYYLEALKVYTEIRGERHLDCALVLNNLSVLNEVMGQYPKAEAMCLESVSIRKEILGSLHPDYALTISNLAYLYDQQGKYKDAQDYYTEALKVFKESLGEKHPEYANTLNKIGNLYANMGDYTRAEALLLQVLDIRRDILGKNHPSYAVTLNDLGLLYKKMGNYIKAESFYWDALDIRGEVLGERHPIYATTLNNIAVLYEVAGNTKEAEKILLEVLDIVKESLGDKNPSYTLTLNNLASLTYANEDYDKTLERLKEAASIEKELLGDRNPSYITTISNMAACYESMNNDVLAEQMYLEVLQKRNEILGIKHPYYATSLCNLALFYKKNKDYEKSKSYFSSLFEVLDYQISNNFPNLSEKEKKEYLSTILSNYESFYSFVLEYAPLQPNCTEQMYNNLLLTKSILLSSTKKLRTRILQSNDQELISIYRQWQEKKETLVKIYQMSQEDKYSQGIEEKKLEEECNTLEKILSAKSEDFKNTIDQRLTWRDVQKRLKANEVAVEMICFNLFDKQWTDSVLYVALLIFPQSDYPEMVVLNNGNDLEHKYLNYYKNSITQLKEDKYSYQQYWSQISDKIKAIAPDTKKIFFSPDGVYNSININTLYNPSKDNFLSDEFDIQLITNTKDIVFSHDSKTQNKGVYLFGYPDYSADSKSPILNTESDVEEILKIDLNDLRFFNGTQITQLPGTKIEVEQIAETFKDQQISIRIFMAQEANESNLKNVRFPKILHIATHGFFMPQKKSDAVSLNNKFKLSGFEKNLFSQNPLLRSGILLAGAEKNLSGNSGTEKGAEDGILTAYEAMSLDLDNTELLILSACETGLGEVKNGEGVYGLQRAFQLAGAKTILMSLWKVSDEVTQELMSLFYEKWLSTSDKQLAFAWAQKQIRLNHPEPYYWGAFVLVGE
jgi:CHAT domain-containing protein